MEIGGRKSDLSRRDLVTTTATADDTDESFGPGTLGARYGNVPQSWDFEADVVVILAANQLRFAEPAPRSIDVTFHLGDQDVDAMVVKIKDERAMKHHVQDAWLAAS